jgi:hypothetical protein
MRLPRNVIFEQLVILRIRHKNKNKQGMDSAMKPNEAECNKVLPQFEGRRLLYLLNILFPKYPRGIFFCPPSVSLFRHLVYIFQPSTFALLYPIIPTQNTVYI